jgi:hypothetical protein
MFMMCIDETPQTDFVSLIIIRERKFTLYQNERDIELPDDVGFLTLRRTSLQSPALGTGGKHLKFSRDIGQRNADDPCG